MDQLPSTSEDVTPGWLNQALSRASNWKWGQIATVSMHPIGGEVSLVSAVFQAKVGMETPDGSTQPLDLLVKMHDSDAPPRLDTVYAAEAYFYRELASTAGIPVPETYVAEFDEQTRRLIIVQEFLSGGRIGSVDDFFGQSDLERVLSMLARLHSVWWRSPLLDELTGVRRFDAIRRNFLKLQQGDPLVSNFLDRFGNIVDPKLTDCYAAMPVWIDSVETRLSRMQTLIHMDCAAKNIFMPDDVTQEPILFDWQLFAAGNPALDLARFFYSDVDPISHDRLYSLVAIYHSNLIDNGVRDYSFEELWDDFRLACMFQLIRSITLSRQGTTFLDEQVRRIVPRLDSVVLRSGALDVLNSLQY